MVLQRATNMIKGTEASLWRGKAQRAVTVQSGKEKAQEDPINVYKYLNRVSKRTCSVLLSVVPSDSTRGNGNRQEVSSRHQETPFRGEGYWALAQILRDLHHWRYWKVVWTWFLTISSRWPCMKRGIGPMISRGPFQTQPFCDITLTSRSWWPQLHLS